MKYDIVVSIVNYKMATDIQKCLETLLPQVMGSLHTIKICVIDNSQNCDGMKEICKGFDTDIVQYIDAGGNIGFGKGHNIIMHKYDAQYYCILNPDTIFVPESIVLDELYAFMQEHPTVGAVTPRLLNDDGSVQIHVQRFPGVWEHPIKRLGLEKHVSFIAKSLDRLLYKDKAFTQPEAIDWAIGAFLFVKGDLYKQMGGFDERYFMYYEDCDMCRTLWSLGYEVYYHPGVYLYHKHRRTSAQGSSSIFKSLLTVIKNPITRIHLKSWARYFLKWGLSKKRP